MTTTTMVHVGPLRIPEHDRHTDLATGAVAVIRGTKPDHTVIENLLSERIQPGSDVTPHLQRVALPPPGDDAELFRAIAHALERPLEPGRPPWECWIIERLEGNQWAILLKIHHGLARDLPPAHLLTRLCDDGDPVAFTDAVARPPVSPPDGDTWWQLPFGAVKIAARVAADVAAAASTWPAPAGPANTLRHYRTVRVPRAAVDRLARKFGVSTNDVAVAAITESFRTVLVSRGEQPRADSLRAVGPTLTYLPVDLEDPVRQLQAVHAGSRQQVQPHPARSPRALYTNIIQSVSRFRKHDAVTLSTGAPGPRHRLQLLGQPLQRLLPVPPTGPQLSTGVAVLSYADDLIFGVTAEYQAAAQLEQLAAGIEQGTTRLLALGRSSVLPFERPRKRPSVPSAAVRWRPSAPPARVRRH